MLKVELFDTVIIINKTTFDILRPDFSEFDINYIYITSNPDFSISKSSDEVHGLQKNQIAFSC